MENIAKREDFSYGKPFTEETINSIVDELKKPFYDGLTILGGEPFEICNQSEVLKLIERVKKEIPERNIWIYTGFTYNLYILIQTMKVLFLLHFLY